MGAFDMLGEKVDEMTNADGYEFWKNILPTLERLGFKLQPAFGRIEAVMERTTQIISPDGQAHFTRNDPQRFWYDFLDSNFAANPAWLSRQYLVEPSATDFAALHRSQIYFGLLMLDNHLGTPEAAKFEIAESNFFLLTGVGMHMSNYRCRTIFAEVFQSFQGTTDSQTHQALDLIKEGLNGLRASREAQTSSDSAVLELLGPTMKQLEIALVRKVPPGVSP